MGINDVNCNCCNAELIRGENAFVHEGTPYCRLCLCGNCSQPIFGRKIFNQREALNYCEDCSCCFCDAPIVGSYVPEGDRKSCLDCCCISCRTPIGRGSGSPPCCKTCRCSKCGSVLGEKYYRDGNEIVCQPCGEAINNHRIAHNNSVKNQSYDDGDDDYNHQSSSRGVSNNYNNSNESSNINNNLCGFCMYELVGALVECADKRYHSACFVCDNCKVNATRMVRQRPYCDECHPDKEVCFACAIPLKGTGLEALGRFYHEHCFVCENCHVQINGFRFKELNEVVLCDNCAADPTVVESLQ